MIEPGMRVSADDVERLRVLGARLETDHPDVCPDLTMFQATHRAIDGAWRTYVTEVSHPGHAVSQRTAAFLACLYLMRKPARILDLGSGFSSFIAARYGAGAEVVAVDTDPMWLAKTRHYLDGHGIQVDLRAWEGFTDPGLFDVVFVDLGGGTVRDGAIRAACDLVDPNGVIVFDDAHHAGHHESMVRACEDTGREWFPLHAWTMDNSYRFAGVGI